MDSIARSCSNTCSGTSSSRSPVRIASETGFVCRYVDSYYKMVLPKVVDMGYGDFDLKIENTVFKTHRHHLVKFGSFAGRIRRALSRDGGTASIKLDGSQQDVDDMTNAFKIIYASVLSGPLKFEPQVLISAFRVAKTYGYPELRTYCIEQLEQCEANLTPTQRIEFARAFDPGSREVATYDAMCKREKPFTDAEMKILGMLAWSMVARVRRLERAKSEPESVSEEIFCADNYTTESCDQGPPSIPVVPMWTEEEEERKMQREMEKEVMNTLRTLAELERIEEEERQRGCEETVQRCRERMREESVVKGKVEERSREQGKRKYNGWEEVEEQEWKGYGREWKGHEQGGKVGETSNSPIKGKNNAATRAFSALSSRYLAVAGRICWKPRATTEIPKPEGVYSSDARDDSTLFDEYPKNMYDDGGELREQKLPR